MTKLNAKFNTAAVKKGDTFQIELTGGGFMGMAWMTEVVSGKATLLRTEENSHSSMGCGPIHYKMTYRADEAGEIEIAGKHKYNDDNKTLCTFKVSVK